MAHFNIHDDLKGRSLAEQVEILWISGPTAGDAKTIAKCLGITENDIPRLVAESVASRKNRKLVKK